MLDEVIQDEAVRPPMLDEAIQDEAVRPPMLDKAIQKICCGQIFVHCHVTIWYVISYKKLPHCS